MPSNTLELDREITKIIQKLNRLPKETFSKRERKKLLGSSAKPALRAIKAKVPVSDKPHHRYNSQGERVATYHPKNLRNSIKLINLRRSPDVFLGPKKGGRNTTGDFKGNRVDGYYGHFVEYGTSRQTPQPYMRPGWGASKGAVQTLIIEGSRKLFNRFKRRSTT